MSQIFPKAANTLARASIAGAGVVAAIVALIVINSNRLPWVNNQSVAREQPVPFYHAHHVGALGLDCRYCHTTADRAAAAGLPPTKTCMNCHSQIWLQSPTLEPVRASWRDDTSIRWTKVHDLPDFVYFNHSAHVNKGVGCTTCHGSIDRMAVVYQQQSLQMEWCLDCHRAPEKYLRPKEEVYSVTYQPPADQLELGRRLVKQYDVQSRVNCSTCHR